VKSGRENAPQQTVSRNFGHPNLAAFQIRDVQDLKNVHQLDRLCARKVDGSAPAGEFSICRIRLDEHDQLESVCTDLRDHEIAVRAGITRRSRKGENGRIELVDGRIPCDWNLGGLGRACAVDDARSSRWQVVVGSQRGLNKKRIEALSDERYLGSQNVTYAQTGNVLHNRRIETYSADLRPALADSRVDTSSKGIRQIELSVPGAGVTRANGNEPVGIDPPDSVTVGLDEPCTQNTGWVAVGRKDRKLVYGPIRVETRDFVRAAFGEPKTAIAKRDRKRSTVRRWNTEFLNDAVRSNPSDLVGIDLCKPDGIGTRWSELS